MDRPAAARGAGAPMRRPRAIGAAKEASERRTARRVTRRVGGANR
ncbi:hypothetical protein [Lysobacter gummosus]